MSANFHTLFQGFCNYLIHFPNIIWLLYTGTRKEGCCLKSVLSFKCNFEITNCLFVGSNGPLGREQLPQRRVQVSKTNVKQTK